jgi:hypothetical protein
VVLERRMLQAMMHHRLKATRSVTQLNALPMNAW